MKIAIIGAGIGGLSAALALHGHELYIFEKRSTFEPLGTGIGIGSNAMQALDSIGLADWDQEYGHPLSLQKFLDTNGRVLKTIDFGEFKRRYGQENITIHRGDLHQVLYDACPKINLTFNKKCISVHQQNNKVHVCFDDGSSDHFDLLIAADGIYSKIRQTIYPHITPKYAGYTCWRGIAKQPAGLKQHTSVEVWGTGKRFGYAPLTNGSFYWFACINARQNDIFYQNLSQREVAYLFSDFPTEVQDLVHSTPDGAFLHHDLYDISPPNSYVDGHIVLLGDAAHATTPNMGQGAGQAIEDAVTLGSLINTYPLDEALEHYNKARVSHTKKVVRVSRQIGKLSQLTSPLLSNGRNALTPFIPSRLLFWRLKFLFEK